MLRLRVAVEYVHAAAMKRTQDSAEAPSVKSSRRSDQMALNFGGQTFVVSRAVLSTFPSTCFSSLASGRIGSTNSDEAVLIDRAPNLFPYIVNHLRTGARSVNMLPKSDEDREALQLEAEYYGLDSLVNALRSFRVRRLHCATVITTDKTHEQKWRTVNAMGFHKSALLFDVCNPHNFELHVEISDACHFIPEPQRACIFIGVAPVDTDLGASWVTVSQDFGEHIYERPRLSGPGVLLALGFFRTGAYSSSDPFHHDVAAAHIFSDSGQLVAKECRGVWAESIGLRFISHGDGNNLVFYWLSHEGDYEEVRAAVDANVLPSGVQYRPVVFFGSRMHITCQEHAEYGNL